MKLINVDARHILKEERDRQFNEGAKKFCVFVGVLSVVVILGTLIIQDVCNVLPYCM